MLSEKKKKAGRPPVNATRVPSDLRVPMTERLKTDLSDVAGDDYSMAGFTRAVMDVVVEGAKRTNEGPGAILARVKELIPSANATTSLPWYGVIGLSSGSDVVRQSGFRVELPAFVRPPSDDCYVLTGQGDSMTGESNLAITDGTRCLFCPSLEPQVGDRVHFEWQNGEKASVKIFKGLDTGTGEYRFVAINPEVDEIRLKRGEVTIKGVLKLTWTPEKP